MQPELDKVESFLLKIEQNEETVFSQYPDYVLYPIVPFFQLVHIHNHEQVIDKIIQFETILGGFLIRVDGYITLACPESSVLEDDLRRLTIQLLELMRF
ncbi:hypothetical protein [Vibrio pectenicida]|uniref:Uncharacterized protein n=1 Tax=Vibrio pectenicida TaxID=62763 RepID=A0A3R9FKQ9_9VIBR|nr:hypothetical protein [Vibrio pectenicida]RSD30304.1 hypothetical protein EJA03_14650 [Vibrio pectenicida]